MSFCLSEEKFTGEEMALIQELILIYQQRKEMTVEKLIAFAKQRNLVSNRERKKLCVLLALADIYSQKDLEKGTAFQLVSLVLFTPDARAVMTNEQIQLAIKLSQKYPHLVPDNWNDLWQ